MRGDYISDSNLRIFSLQVMVAGKDKEIERLRAENERLREALKPFADEFSLYKTDFPDHFYISDLGFTFGQLRAARVALEGVTKPASPWRDIKSAPKDGTKILAFARSHTDYYGVAQWAEAAPDFQRSAAGWFWAFVIRPTHWMPIPEPPNND